MAKTDYETLFILKPELTDEEVETQVGKLTTLITDGGGEIIETDLQGKRRLAYPVQKNKYGYYVLVRFSTDPSQITGIEKFFRFTEEFIKYLVVLFDGAAGRNLKKAEDAEDKENEQKQETATTTETSE